MINKNIVGVGAKEVQRGRLNVEQKNSNTGVQASKAKASVELTGMKIIRVDGTEEIIK